MKRILIADDEPGVRSLLVKWLTLQGYDVAAAADGIEACRAAEQGAFDLILLDLMLPRQDGFATMLHLRTTAACAHTPVLVLSGEADLDETVATLGAQGFIAKPFHRSEVMARIEEMLHITA